MAVNRGNLSYIFLFDIVYSRYIVNDYSYFGEDYINILNTLIIGVSEYSLVLVKRGTIIIYIINTSR